MQDCKLEKQLTDLQAFRRFIYISFNDYNYNERATTATIGNRKTIPLELTADSNTDEMIYITDMLDFAKWTESELNGLHALSLTSDAAQVTFGEPEWGEWSDAEPQADPITPVK